MLIEFSIGNYRSFKEKATISFIASNYDKSIRETENVFINEKFGLRLLKSAVIYGANASGKSKFLEAFGFVKDMIINSSKKLQVGEKIKVHPFMLHSDWDTKPSKFEIIFVYKEVMYRYGFSITEKCIVSEWLYQKSLRKEVKIFDRKFQKFHFHSTQFRKGKSLEKEGLIRENALLISVAAQFNDKIAINVIEALLKLHYISGIQEEGFKGFTLSQTSIPQNKEKILNFLKAADVGINDISVKKMKLEELPEKLPNGIKEMIKNKIGNNNYAIFSDTKTLHKKYNSDFLFDKNIQFSMEMDESSGTQKYFALAGPILECLSKGEILVVDELDSKLHPNLIEKITELFNSKENNPYNAQIIFNTHNTNLLSADVLRRDQFWFTEKDRYGASSLYSLADFKETVRKNDNFENNYLIGRYGAIPYLQDFNIKKIVNRKYQ